MRKSRHGNHLNMSWTPCACTIA
ncbi:hypothetical protein ID866_8011 [Astraeus odoratus]|nr:hypothetical protein ID866_8011 [Astraeus odoratus]